MTFRAFLIAATVLMPFVPCSRAQVQDAGNQLAVATTDWAWWRGPNRNGVADPGQSPPLQWDEEKNVVWKVPVPGRGYSSPTVIGDRVILATADEADQVQSVICYDRNTGEQRWKTDVHQGGFQCNGKEPHVRSSMASATVASDGERLFAAFINDSAVHLTALDLDGAQQWQKKVCDYVMHQGFAASPAVYGPLVIVLADHKGGGTLSAYNRATGELAWTQARPALPNYTSPIILNVAGSDQLLTFGCDRIVSYAPLTGAVNWDIEGSTTECVTSLVSDGNAVVTSGGYPSKHISVVRGDGSGETVWRNETMIYVPSMLVHKGHLYAVSDSGEVYCYDMANGNLAWEHRIRGKFGASPVLVGENIFATSDDGVTYIFKASPAGFESAGENTIPADEVQATPAYCGDRIYMRLTSGKGADRQELLYCLGS
jgi:outer membrane protein assembly factor BamB